MLSRNHHNSISFRFHECRKDKKTIRHVKIARFTQINTIVYECTEQLLRSDGGIGKINCLGFQGILYGFDKFMDRVLGEFKITDESVHYK